MTSQSLSPSSINSADGANCAVLGSHRLRLRPIEDRDAAHLVEIDRDERVKQFLVDDPLDTPLRALAAITYAQSLRKQTEHLGIWSASDDQDAFLGYFSLMPTADDDVELGVKLAPQHWGRSYALEGGRLLCRYAAEATPLSSLVGIFSADNRVIPLLLKRLGFSFCARIKHFDQPAVRFRLTF